jgi:hypothetical protein
MPCEELVGRDVDERAMFYDAGGGKNAYFTLTESL